MLEEIKEQTKDNGAAFPIVAIGAAAGGPEALSELLKHLPDNLGMAYVYIQHPESEVNGALVPRMSSLTEMRVQEAAENLPLHKDVVYIVPTDHSLQLAGGSFVKEEESTISYMGHMPINRFFSTLAEEYREKAIGVLFSGAAYDGALGMKAIKLAGGLTFAQNETAKFQSMPRSAQSDGGVDIMLSPKELAEELSKIIRKPHAFNWDKYEVNEGLLPEGSEVLKGILHVLLRSTGVDFAQYKMNTIKRRIIRRIMLYKLETAAEYLSYLKQNINEVNFLYQDLLINVTTFFRDEETAHHLRNVLLPKIVELKRINEPIRIWIAACSTGQEAYSLAMLVLEVLGENPSNIQVQIFATDLSEMAINKARLGVYTPDEVIGVSPKRLQRFFTKHDGHYRIIKSIRDMCVFANHNIAKDPPFSKLDIISCCNLMIYLDTPLQKKILATFHYSLNSSGYLVMGKSETVGASAYLFSQADKKIKVYAKKKDATTRALFETNTWTTEPGKVLPLSSADKPVKAKIKNDELDLEQAVDSLLLRKFIPASVVVNYDLDILQFRGTTGLYLEPSPGKASLNLLKMAKPGLGFELRNIIHKAKKTGETVVKAGLEITIGQKSQRISIEAVPLKLDAEQDYFLIVFREISTLFDDQEYGNVKDKRVAQLEAELTALREDLRSIVESQEAANEELQSANEEIVSSNEELQSINEELETSKEEIESSNEELITINQELQIRNEQLAEAQEYSEAFFTTIREALVIMDKNLRIKSANKTFYNMFRLREENVEGRIIYDLSNSEWNMGPLRHLLGELVPNNGQYYGIEITQNFLGLGEKTLILNSRKVVQKSHAQEVIILAIEDITTYRQSQKIIEEREAWFRNMADNAPVMIWVTGSDKLCNFVNQYFLEFRGISLKEAVGNKWTLDAHPNDEAHLLKVYEECFREKKPFEMVYRLKHKEGNYRQVLTRAKPNFTTEGSFTGFIGSCVEIDEKVKEAVK